jgi:hypothetical protein
MSFRQVVLARHVEIARLEGRDRRPEIPAAKKSPAFRDPIGRIAMGFLPTPGHRQQPQRQEHNRDAACPLKCKVRFMAPFLHCESSRPSTIPPPASFPKRSTNLNRGDATRQGENEVLFSKMIAPPRSLWWKYDYVC